MIFIIVISSLLHTSLGIDTNYSSYRRIPLCQAQDQIRFPANIQDVVELVNEAIKRSTTIKIFGARHSQTDIICTDGIPVDNRNLIKFELNPDNTATFGGGVSLFDATEFLKQKNRGLRTIPAFGNITMAGAIGTGAHGSSVKFTSSISSQVVGLTIVNGLGQVVKITREEDLNAFRVNLGLLGIVVDVTLITVPLYKALGHNYAISDNALMDGRVIEWARNTDEISVYWFPQLEEIVVANWTFVPVDTPGNAFTNDHVPSTLDAFNDVIAPLAENLFKLTDSPCPPVSTLGYTLLSAFGMYQKSTLLQNTPLFVPIYTEDGINVENPAVGYYDRMLAPTCRDGPTPDGLTCLWSHVNAPNILILDNEMSLNLDDLSDVVTVVKDILSKSPTIFPLQGILLRFQGKSDTYMSNTFGRDSVHFEWYTWLRMGGKNIQPASLAGYQTIMQVLVNRFKGRSHWGKSGMAYHTADMISKMLDPIAKSKFIETMDTFDPRGIFLNKFGKRLKGQGTEMDLDPLVTKCALIDNCICSSDADCGKAQECKSISGYEGMPVCKTIGVKPPLKKHLTNSDLTPSSAKDFFIWANTVPMLIARLATTVDNCLLNPLLNILG